jgi:hypothetical protein
MRAYVITDRVSMADDVDDPTNVVGVTSSRKTAIKSVEDFLGGTGEPGSLKWHVKSKHTGCASLGDHTVTYGMFFVNRIEE